MLNGGIKTLKKRSRQVGTGSNEQDEILKG